MNSVQAKRILSGVLNRTTLIIEQCYNTVMLKRLLLILGIILLLTLFLVIPEVLYIRYTGITVPAPSIPREIQTFGETGAPLRYVVMGDSTTISQGGTYENGFAIQSARHLAQKYKVTFLNTGISGATAQSVKEVQLDQAVKFKPDVVLLAVGANDVTHRTPLATVNANLQVIIDQLRQANPRIVIVFTRSPAVDAVTRFPFGAKQLVRNQVERFNKYLEPLIARSNVIVAPIAEDTRQAFLDNPSLLAADKFHPNDSGYALWTPVITKALDRALQ